VSAACRSFWPWALASLIARTEGIETLDVHAIRDPDALSRASSPAPRALKHDVRHPRSQVRLTSRASSPAPRALKHFRLELFLLVGVLASLIARTEGIETTRTPVATTPQATGSRASSPAPRALKRR